MPRKRWIGLGLLAVAAIAGVTAWSLRGDYARARIATAHAAKQSCSCVQVSGRPLEACLAELPQTNQVTVTQDGAHMRANTLFGAIHAEADYEDAYGCRLTD